MYYGKGKEITENEAKVRSGVDRKGKGREG